jgi:D-alanine-D-alanine ligase
MFTRLDLPLVVKPVTEGSSIGVTIVKDLAKLKKVLKATMAEFGRVFAEKYIQGREVTVGVIGSGRAVKVLPVLELLPKADFYNYQAKYTQGGTELVVPAKFSLRLTRKIQMVALRTFRALGADGVSRIDIIVKGEHLYVHDVNTIPGMTDLSDLPAAAAAAGISYDQLVLEILLSAFQRRH